MLNSNLKVFFLASMFCLGCSSQSPDYELYEMIGLMDFHLGPQRMLEHSAEKNKITFFYNSDSLAIKEFKKIIIAKKDMKLNDYKFIRTQSFDGNSGPVVFSEKYHYLLSSFFDFEFSFVHTDESGDDYKIYNGNLKKSKFGTEKQKMYFLKGLFVRYGEVYEGQVYKYKLSSTPHNNKLIIEFLKDVGSDIVEIRGNNKELTPGVNTIVFKPSEKLKKLLISN